MIRLPIQVTHAVVSHVVVAFDVSYGRDDIGTSAATQYPDREIVANLQPAGDELLQLLPEGAQTDGAKVMHTVAPIYVATNGQGMQTYVRHGGQVWKAHAVQDWEPHASIGRWILTRHLDIDGITS